MKRRQRKAPVTEQLKKHKAAYGGELRKTRAGRRGGRPLPKRGFVHLAMRSSKATGRWAFDKPAHWENIEEIAHRFGNKYNVAVLSIKPSGKSLHFVLRLRDASRYRPFIQAVSSAIMMAITGYSRWKKRPAGEKFWDYRPFTRVLDSPALSARDLRAFE